MVDSPEVNAYVRCRYTDGRVPTHQQARVSFDETLIDMSKKQDVHVVPSGGRWAVKKQGAKRASSLHDTQSAAIETGREIARAGRAELVIHRPNGQIRDSDSYGNDPNPPKDTKH